MIQPSRFLVQPEAFLFCLLRPENLNFRFDLLRKRNSDRADIYWQTRIAQANIMPNAPILYCGLSHQLDGVIDLHKR
jgi:hypothetical protein